MSSTEVLRIASDIARWLAHRGSYTHDSGVDGDPAAFEVTVTFEEVSGKTKVTMHAVFPTAAELARVKGFGAVEGGKQTLQRLAEWLAA
jgi:uncharacterized protein YndB with AHSA1/START domain